VTAESLPLLILDLDECLIHAHESPLDRPGDFLVGPYHVYKRPHVDQFLTTASQWYQMAIWSSGSTDYVQAIVSQLKPAAFGCQFVWGRERCTRRYDHDVGEEAFIKDLKKVKRLGFSLEKILFVDDTHSKLARNYGNAIYIPPFEGAFDDEELLKLLRYLETIRDVENFRLLEKRGWRHRR
jgi:TFIIF-interacting CTD phosphatase-like protein